MRTSLLAALLLPCAALQHGDGRNGETRNRHAFLTLIASDNWVPGTFALGCSLRDFAREHGVDMVAFCYDLSEAKLEDVRRAGWRCESPELIQNPVRGRWPYDYTLKIEPFRMTQYERIVVFDSDMVAMNQYGLQELFDRPFPADHIMAAPDCAAHFLGQWSGKEAAEIMIQAGLIVLRPSARQYEALLSEVPRIESLDGGCQGFMSLAFKGRVSWLPAKFNYVRATKCVSSIDRQTGYYDFEGRGLHWFGNMEAAQERAEADVAGGNVTVAHFHFSPKPWDCDPARVSECGRRWADGYSNLDVLYKVWLDTVAQCKHR